MTGKLATSEGTEKFEWSLCTAKVFTPKAKYDPRGVFAYFENYKVEDRDRVKCISGSEGKICIENFLLRSEGKIFMYLM